MVMVIMDITDMATDITDMVIIMDIIWVRDPPMLNQLLPPNLQLPQKPLLKPKLHLGTDTVTDTMVMVMDTDITVTDTDILMVIIMDIIWANDPPNLPLKLMPPPHLTTLTTDTVIDTDTDTTDIPTITDMLTITANDQPNLPLKPHPHLITDTDTTDTTVMVTDTDTTDIMVMDTATTTANNKDTTTLNNATTFIMAYLVLKKKIEIFF